MRENICPVCNSNDLNFDGFELVEESKGYFNCECLECGTTFKQWYRLKFVEITNVEP